MATPITVTISEYRQLAGAGAAAVAAEMDTAAYLQDVLSKACDSYRSAYGVDRITSSDFIYRSTPLEFADINASSDPVVQDFIAQVKAAPYVWLGSVEVIAGMDYVVAAGLLTAARKDEILFYPIPEYVPPTPDP